MTGFVNQYVTKKDYKLVPFKKNEKNFLNFTRNEIPSLQYIDICDLRKKKQYM